MTTTMRSASSDSNVARAERRLAENLRRTDDAEVEKQIAAKQKKRG